MEAATVIQDARRFYSFTIFAGPGSLAISATLRRFRTVSAGSYESHDATRRRRRLAAADKTMSLALEASDEDRGQACAKAAEEIAMLRAAASNAAAKVADAEKQVALFGRLISVGDGCPS
jgi:hypothetical protein